MKKKRIRGSVKSILGLMLCAVVLISGAGSVFAASKPVKGELIKRSVGNEEISYSTPVLRINQQDKVELFLNGVSEMDETSSYWVTYAKNGEEKVEQGLHIKNDPNKLYEYYGDECFKANGYFYGYSMGYLYKYEENCKALKKVSLKKSWSYFKKGSSEDNFDSFQICSMANILNVSKNDTVTLVMTHLYQHQSCGCL